MENVAWAQKVQISSKYDLKGSWLASCVALCMHLRRASLCTPQELCGETYSDKHPSLVNCRRVARQVLMHEVDVRRQLSLNCKRHQGTLKDLDMNFVVKQPPFASIILSRLIFRYRFLGAEGLEIC